MSLGSTKKGLSAVFELAELGGRVLESSLRL